MEEVKITPNTLIDEKLLKVISHNTGMSKKQSEDIISYNVITVYQLAKITNRSTSAIQNLMRPLREGDKPKLRSVLPFKYKENKGFVFILFDQACYDYIMSTNKK